MTWWPFTARGTAALGIAAASFAIAGETGVIELVYFGVLLVALTAVSFGSLWLRGAPSAAARRVTPEVPVAGTATKVTVAVKAPARVLSRTARWYEDAAPTFAGDLAGDLTWKTGGEPVMISYTASPATRGSHSLGPLRIVSVDPFGLARRAVKVLPAVHVRVAPAPADVSALQGMTASAGGALHTTVAERGHGVDDLLARQYQPGDSMRRIHWRASAHHDGLMVRQEENETAPDAIVVLDLDRTRWGEGAAHAPGRDPAFEAAVSTAVSAASQLLQDGYTVTVLDGAGVTLCEAVEPGERALLDAFAASCATVVATEGPSILELPRSLAQSGSGPIVLVTGVIGERDVVELAPIGAHSARPVLLSTQPSPDALERARDQGWRVHTIPVGPDMPRWWDDARERS